MLDDATTQGFEGRNSAFDSLTQPRLDERARQQFVSQLRRHIMVDMAASMRKVYEREVEPGIVARHKRAPRNAIDVRRAMLPNPYFRAWSALRTTAQEMTWSSVRPQIERDLPKLVTAAGKLAGQSAKRAGSRAKHAGSVAKRASRAKGSLRLDPTLAIPKDMQQLDIHLMPGGFHSEWVPGDVAAGALYHHGTAVFAGGFALRARGGGVAKSIAHYLKARDSKFEPRRLLDLGCTVGGNLLPYLEVFPDCEAYGIDVCAPLLRYAHARAESLGAAVHYSQQNAEHTDFPDDMFDIVCSSFFLHEHSIAVTRRVFKEARRILKPGGIMVHMELPPDSQTNPYYSFYLNWDAYYNNEPHYAAFRALDLRNEVLGAGFEPQKFFAVRIPNHGTVSEAEFAAVARGEREAPAHGNGASWFIFGAAK
jgi:SAM-dependent methyltransferase